MDALRSLRGALSTSCHSDDHRHRSGGPGPHYHLQRHGSRCRHLEGCGVCPSQLPRISHVTVHRVQVGPPAGSEATVRTGSGRVLGTCMASPVSPLRSPVRAALCLSYMGGSHGTGDPAVESVLSDFRAPGLCPPPRPLIVAQSASLLMGVRGPGVCSGPGAGWSPTSRSPPRPGRGPSLLEGDWSDWPGVATTLGPRGVREWDQCLLGTGGQTVSTAPSVCCSEWGLSGRGLRFP